MEEAEGQGFTYDNGDDSWVLELIRSYSSREIGCTTNQSRTSSSNNTRHSLQNNPTTNSSSSTPATTPSKFESCSEGSPISMPSNPSSPLSLSPPHDTTRVMEGKSSKASSPSDDDSTSSGLRTGVPYLVKLIMCYGIGSGCMPCFRPKKQRHKKEKEKKKKKKIRGFDSNDNCSGSNKNNESDEKLKEAIAHCKQSMASLEVD